MEPETRLPLHPTITQSIQNGLLAKREREKQTAKERKVEEAAKVASLVKTLAARDIFMNNLPQVIEYRTSLGMNDVTWRWADWHSMEYRPSPQTILDLMHKQDEYFGGSPQSFCEAVVEAAKAMGLDAGWGKCNRLRGFDNTVDEYVLTISWDNAEAFQPAPNYVI